MRRWPVTEDVSICIHGHAQWQWSGRRGSAGGNGRSIIGWAGLTGAATFLRRKRRSHQVRTTNAIIASGIAAAMSSGIDMARIPSITIAQSVKEREVRKESWRKRAEDL